MFAGFKLSESNIFLDYQEIGEEIFRNCKKQVTKELEVFTNSKGKIDGSSLQSNWFPQIEADIFISHSHQNESVVKGLAGWLYKEFGLRVFIDSCIWGYSLELLKEIDNKYCLNDGKETYDYQKRNYSTSHVYMMLSIALTKMIDKTECIFFLDTPESICAKGVIDKTNSPWLYHEIAMSDLVRKRKLSEYRQGFIKKGVYNEQKSLEIEYDVDLAHLYELAEIDLIRWGIEFKKGEYGKHPLDFLYKNKGLLK